LTTWLLQVVVVVETLAQITVVVVELEVTELPRVRLVVVVLQN
jgi:hypothetical protein